MAVAGMLRIHQVMGLFRLYCVPLRRPTTDGVYLRYHPDELLAILALESHRANCATADEDLGTVPPQVRPAMGGISGPGSVGYLPRSTAGVEIEHFATTSFARLPQCWIPIAGR